MSNTLNLTGSLIYNQLSNFSGLKNFWNLFDTVFGTEYDHTVAAKLHSQWQSGDFSQFPKIEIISNSIFEDTHTGYVSSSNKIYLLDSLIATATPTAIKAVLLKEIGNFIHGVIQPTNISGDKGAIFADLVLSNSSTNPAPAPTSILQPTLIQALQSSKAHAQRCSCSSCMLAPVNFNLVSAQTSQLPQTASATLDLSKTFSLNSLAGANQTIYLDFNGHTTSGTYWNTDFKSGANIVTPAFDFDGNTASFSSAELERIQYIWQRVAEDFSPFNVNITTQAPTDINDLIRSGSTDTRWGVRVVVGGSSYDLLGDGAGGVAYLDSFNWNNDTPAYVFSKNLQNSEKYTAEAISHEVGHTLGLSHDGRINPAEGYYNGHGSGVTGWAGIMGAGYYQNLTQWSKGEYASANNTEDDLQIITTYNGFSYRTDDAGNTITTAKSLAISGTSVTGSGIIERNTDVDFYSFVTGAGAINLTVDPFSRGPNLDILAKLYNSAGTLIASSNPTDLLSAAIATTVTAGTYYLAIDGVGKGDILSTGYTDYGSLGQYFISGSIVSSSTIPSNPTVSLALSSTSVDEDGSSNLIYTFTRSGSTTNTLKVNYSVGGTATFNSDYRQLGATSFTATTGTITFAAGASTATLTIDPTADTTFETNETVVLTLANGSGYTIGTTTAVTATIVNDDLPTITLSVSSSSVNEDGSSNLIYTFTRSGSNINALTVNYGVSGTATFNSDYSQLGAASFTATNGTITFAAGASTATLNIDPTADTTFETNENVTLTLAAGSGYKIGTTTGITRSIVNDDLRPTINLSSSQTIIEGNTNPQNVTYLVTLSNASSQTITVYYSTVNASATAGSDYTATAGTLTFNPGVTSQVINIPILNDSLNEADESFILSLKSPTNATLSTTTSVTTTITDTLVTSVTTNLPTNVENLTLTGTAAINGTGNAGNNILTGNSGNNTLTGEDGNDTYLLSAITPLGTDRIVETTTGGIDTIDFRGTTISSNLNLGITTTQTVNNNLNLIFSANNVIENATGGIGNDAITGNALNNILTGGNGNDQLQGLAGDDTLWGGLDDDILTGGVGKDKYLFQADGVFSTNLGIDHITDFEGGQDQIVLSKSTFKAITNSAGQTLTDFAVVTDDQFVNASSKRIVYSQSTGSLFYNQDGNVLGTGTVFEFARLGNSSITLTGSDFSLIV
ncbi:Calx-beta domain-containing protein [Nostoc sp. PCC 7107]|uniref:Calx-beta domain-containing protein n=1 Tax=Nostoc sp. PCC 7107 TaxID=317936 RepID=UPI00029F4C96|nr:Calx-beta domain-containing protein [Nostoc sp. PCC 7107]AFY42577.1 Na-Ca exchanger/integrin-beta4 [Nostoc sp. PCC 7107]